MIYITKGFHLLLTIIIIQNSFGHWAKQFRGDEIYPFHSSGKFDLFLNHQLKTIYWRVKRVRFNLDECKRNILSHKTQVRKAVQIPNELALFYDNYTFLKRCHNQQILHLRHFLLQTNFTFNVIIHHRPFVHKGIKGKCLNVSCFLFIPDTVSFLFLWGVQASQVIDCLVAGAGVVLVVVISSHYSVLISAW